MSFQTKQTVLNGPLMKRIDDYAEQQNIEYFLEGVQYLFFFVLTKMTIFHLFLVAFTQKGTKILIEKNHVINISLTQKAESEKREEIHIPINKPITINELLEKTKERMGSNFLIYSASTYNCQNFIMNILEANGLETPESRKFIMQDTEQVFKGLPNIFKKGSDFITNLASHGDVLLNGLGKRKRKRKT